MIEPEELRVAAERALESAASEADFRRCISTAYYALFHLLVADAASALFPNAGDRGLMWRVRRAFEHKKMSTVSQCFCGKATYSKALQALLKDSSGNPQTIPSALEQAAFYFVELQQSREEADYNPAVEIGYDAANLAVDRANKAFVAWKSVRSSAIARIYLAALLLDTLWKS